MLHSDRHDRWWRFLPTNESRFTACRNLLTDLIHAGKWDYSTEWYIGAFIVLIFFIYIFRSLDEIQKYIFPHINIDITIAQRYESLTFDQVKNLTRNQESRHSYCLLHFFTGKAIFKWDSDLPIYGASMTKGLPDENYGSTSLGACRERPWNFWCIRTFSHELFHSIGSDHDSMDYNATSIRHHQYIMAIEAEGIDQRIGSNNLVYLYAYPITIWPPTICISLEAVKWFTSWNISIYAKVKVWSRLWKVVPWWQVLQNILIHSFFNWLLDWVKCGNDIMEDGEECDEGKGQLCCKLNCKLKSGAHCSPRNSLCCADTCQFGSRACMPYVFFNDALHYCQHKTLYCSDGGIEEWLDCPAVLQRILTTTKTIAAITTIITAITTETSTVSTFEQTTNLESMNTSSTFDISDHTADGTSSFTCYLVGKFLFFSFISFHIVIHCIYKYTCSTRSIIYRSITSRSDLLSYKQKETKSFSTNSAKRLNRIRNFGPWPQFEKTLT